NYFDGLNQLLKALKRSHKPEDEKPVKQSKLVTKNNGNVSVEHQTVNFSRLTMPIVELDRELVARNKKLGYKQFRFSDRQGTPQRQELFDQVKKTYNQPITLNIALEHYTTWELTQKIRLMIDAEKSNLSRSGIFSDDRMDFFDIYDDRVRKNALSVVLICIYKDLLPSGSGYCRLNSKNYGRVFNLHVSEPFRDQPIAAGPMCSGVLVGKNIIATAAHFLNGKNVTDLRFVFDFIMQDPIFPVEQIPEDNIYKGVEILDRVHNPESNWMLIKLDRSVTGREIAVLSQRIFSMNSRSM
ncbi:MAG: S1 family peptidase, partial [Acidobacteria bacterium]|nr:S1 family peptidase [Acidobacteriota bacterium]